MGHGIVLLCVPLPIILLVSMKRPGQPKELAPVYVMLATDEASYVSGATVAVTGGKPIV
jgi:NAD(P)-dependent dehydrogenase (short-subunit alcohol dehydrogenase family)